MAFVRQKGGNSTKSRIQKGRRFSYVRLKRVNDSSNQGVSRIEISPEQRALMALEYPHLYSAPARDLLKAASGIPFE